MRRHAALRLVIDNSSAGSSETRRSRAKSSKARCQRPGIPRAGQLRIAEAEIPNAPAKASAPPKRSISSLVLAMENDISQSGTFFNPNLRHLGKNLPETSPRTKSPNRVTIWDMAKSDLEKTFGGRLKLARQALFDGSAEDFAKRIGKKPQTYRNWERDDRCRLDPSDVADIALEGISLNWLFLAEKPILDAFKAAEAQQRRREAS